MSTIGSCAWETRVRRHDADDGAGATARRDLLADGVFGAKALAPEPVRQDDGVVGLLVAAVNCLPTRGETPSSGNSVAVTVVVGARSRPASEGTSIVVLTERPIGQSSWRLVPPDT